MDRDNFIGAMVNITQDNGSRVKSQEMVIGDPVQDRAIWENGLMGR